MVVVLLTVMGPLYKVPAVSLGALPSVVYRMDAPEVAVLMLTITVALYPPGVGLKLGDPTCASRVCNVPSLANVPGELWLLYSVATQPGDRAMLEIRTSSRIPWK